MLEWWSRCIAPPHRVVLLMKLLPGSGVKSLPRDPLQEGLPNVTMLFSERTAPPYCAELFQSSVTYSKTMELATTWIAPPCWLVELWIVVIPLKVRLVHAADIDPPLIAAELLTKWSAPLKFTFPARI